MPRLTAQQLEERRSFIGASDISAIAGLNPFRDAFDVLNEKLGFATSGGDNEAADWGHRLEPVIRDWYVTDQACAVTPCGTVRHPVHEWAAATLDSKIIGTRRGLEIKAVGTRMIYDWDPGDDAGVPHYVRTQCEWQMWCVDLEEIDVAALLGGTVARVWRIAADLELRAALVAAGEKFWRDQVQGRIAPALTDADGVRAYLNGIYPPVDPPVIVDADEESTRLAVLRESSKQAQKDGEHYEKTATAELIKWLGDRNATDIVGPDWTFRYRKMKNGERRPYFKRKGDKAP